MKSTKVQTFGTIGAPCLYCATRLRPKRTRPCFVMKKENNYIIIKLK